MDVAEDWRGTPSPAPVDHAPLPWWALPAPSQPLSAMPSPRSPEGRRERRWGDTPFGLAALVTALIALTAGIIATIVGVFCVGFITAFGAPLDVTRPAMAGFAVRGSAITAALLLVALVLLVVGLFRRLPPRWWIAPAVINCATLLGLAIASLIWFHPGTHISWDFSS